MSSMVIFGYWKHLNNKTLENAVNHYLQDAPMTLEEIEEMFKYLRGWKIMLYEYIPQSSVRQYPTTKQGVNQAIQDLLKIGIDPL